MSTGDEFEEIAEELLSKASDVKCNIEDYYRGLLTIQGRVQTALDCADSDGVDLEELS